mmetsp:Transcript_121235/g.354396  ORF Transcript_121235/g.354396 Transcript_121235/m.354396 type:complete len:204 (+) Transcript_121235:458-1069(+)
MAMLVIAPAHVSWPASEMAALRGRARSWKPPSRCLLRRWSSIWARRSTRWTALTRTGTDRPATSRASSRPARSCLGSREGRPTCTGRPPSMGSPGCGPRTSPGRGPPLRRLARASAASSPQSSLPRRWPPWTSVMPPSRSGTSLSSSEASTGSRRMCAEHRWQRSKPNCRPCGPRSGRRARSLANAGLKPRRRLSPIRRTSSI